MKERLKRDIEFYCKKIEDVKDKIDYVFNDLSSDIQGFLDNMKEYCFYKPYVFDFVFDYDIDGKTYKIKISRENSDSFFSGNSCSLSENEITYIEEKPNGAKNELLSVIKEIYYGKDREFLFPNKDNSYYRSILNMKSDDVSSTYIANAVYFCHKDAIMKSVEHFKNICNQNQFYVWRLFEENEIYKDFIMIEKTIQYLDERILMKIDLSKSEKELYGNNLTIEKLRRELSKMEIWFKKQTALMISYLDSNKKHIRFHCFHNLNNNSKLLSDEGHILFF